MPDVWGLASFAAKFALYFGVLTSVGTVLAIVLFQLPRHRGFAVSFAFIGLAATLFGFSLAGAALTGDASGLTDPEMLGLLWSTSVGTAVALRIAGLSLLIVGLFASSFIKRVGLAVAVIGATLSLWSFVYFGHIPDRDSLILNFVLLFHLAAISLWIGVLSPLRGLALDQNRFKATTDLGHRFGTLAAVFVPLLILAGGYMSYELVGSFSGLVGSGYGQALILKVVFVAGLLSLAAVNKLRFIPQMSKGDQGAARHLAKSISFEWLAIAAVLLVTAVLTSVLTLPT